MTLRKLEPSDLPYLYRWENDAASWADGDVHHPLSQQDLRDYIASTTGDFFRDGQLRLVITSEAGETLGMADLFDLDIRNRKAAVGLYVAPEVRGRGVAREAMQALETLACRDLGLRMIYAFISTKNMPCLALFRQLGYTESAPVPAWTLEADAVLFSKCLA